MNKRDINIAILKYSDKAIAVFGNTREVRQELKSLGGRFNGHLRHPLTGKKKAGWIFSQKRKDAVRSYFITRQDINLV